MAEGSTVECRSFFFFFLFKISVHIGNGSGLGCVKLVAMFYENIIATLGHLVNRLFTPV